MSRQVGEASTNHLDNPSSIMSPRVGPLLDARAPQSPLGWSRRWGAVRAPALYHDVPRTMHVSYCVCACLTLATAVAPMVKLATKGLSSKSSSTATGVALRATPLAGISCRNNRMHGLTVKASAAAPSPVVAAAGGSAFVWKGAKIVPMLMSIAVGLVVQFLIPCPVGRASPK